VKLSSLSIKDTAINDLFFFKKKTSLYTKVNETKGGLHLSLISLEIEDLVSYAVPTSRKGNVNEYYHHAAKKGKLAT
jgi:hypothetical protein